MYIVLRLASLGGGPQAHVHMKGMKCRVLYLNVLAWMLCFCEPKATPAQRHPYIESLLTLWYWVAWCLCVHAYLCVHECMCTAWCWCVHGFCQCEGRTVNTSFWLISGLGYIHVSVSWNPASISWLNYATAIQALHSDGALHLRL